jgi:alkyl hydroperoxide reductase subunit AhpC
VAQLRQRKDAFHRAGARVVLVGLGTPEETAAFKTRFDVPFPMISDPEKRLFAAFGLKQMSPAGILSPGMALKGVAAMLKGHGMGLPKGDVRQLPGVFIIDAGGRIRFSHYARGPADHPSPQVILDALGEIKSAPLSVPS